MYCQPEFAVEEDPPPPKGEAAEEPPPNIDPPPPLLLLLGAAGAAPPPKMEPVEAGAVVVFAPPKVNPELAVVATAEPNTELEVNSIALLKSQQTFQHTFQQYM